MRPLNKDLLIPDKRAPQPSATIRPAAPQEREPAPETDVISARFPLDVLRDLDAYCERQGIKKSKFLRLAVEEQLKAALAAEQETSSEGSALV